VIVGLERSINQASSPRDLQRGKRDASWSWEDERGCVRGRGGETIHDMHVGQKKSNLGGKISGKESPAPSKDWGAYLPKQRGKSNRNKSAKAEPALAGQGG